MNAYIIMFTLIATLGGLLFGYDTAVISGAVGSLKAYFIDPRNLSDPNAVNSLWGIVNSSALVGCIIGGLIGGWVSTKIGRKRGLIIAAILFLRIGSYGMTSVLAAIIMWLLVPETKGRTLEQMEAL